MTTIVYERQTCTRCLGTGKYSYNALHGDRCYGCGGKGRQLTKRAEKAKRAVGEVLRRLETIATNLRPGDLVRAYEFDADFAGAVEILTIAAEGEYGRGGHMIGTMRRGEVVEPFKIQQSRIVRRARYSDAEKAEALAVAAKFPGAAWLE
jgi:hypothetical protein